MKAAVFYKKHDLQIEKKDIPRAGADEVVVKGYGVRYMRNRYTYF